MTPKHRVHFCSKIALDQIKETEEEHETNPANPGVFHFLRIPKHKNGRFCALEA